MRIEGVLLEICFFRGGNYRYGFVVGRTDNEGCLKISFDDIERCRLKNARENLMDYNTPLEDCDPTIRIAAPSDQQLRELAKNAMHFYSNPPGWAKPWPANGQIKAVEEEVALVGNTTTVRLRAD